MSTEPPPDRHLRESERARLRAAEILGRETPHASKALARIKRIKSEQPKHLDLSRITRLMARAPHAPRPRTAPAHQYARRAFVRIRYAPARKAGHWRAHALYLEREGAQRENGRGTGFNAGSQTVSLSTLADSWQKAGDDKIFKIVLSPEDADRLDLVDYTRKFMTRFEQQAGQSLEWAAIDHHNTGQPHVHLLIRGQGLILSPELIGQQARDIASDEATRALGYRTPVEISAGRDRELDQRRFTSIDRELKRQAVLDPTPGADGAFLVSIQSDQRTFKNPHLLKAQHQRIGRLQNLEKIGVAQRVGNITWRLDAGWETALKELDTLHQRSTMLMQHRALMSDPRALPVITKLEPGQRLTGRVLGTGLNDANQSAYILIEGTDGKAHFISQTNSIEEKRGQGTLKPGGLVTIECKLTKSERPFIAVTDHNLEIPARGFTNIEIPAAVLDADLKHRSQSQQTLPTQPVTTGFAGHYQRALIDRQRQQELTRNRKRAPSRAVDDGLE